MNILGINTFFEHPSVALVRDGALIFAIEDERMTRIKHGKRYTPYRTYLPYDAIYLALQSQGLRASDIDEIAFSYNRWAHLFSLWGCFTGERTSSLRDELSAFWSIANFRAALVGGYELPRRYRDLLPPGALAKLKYREWDHHSSHAASAFFCSGYERALVVVSDGSGERACTTVYLGHGRRMRKLAQMSLPHSLGLFYSCVTAHLGFEPFSDEYKVMGLAAYGEPRLKGEMDSIVTLLPRGRYRVDASKMRRLEGVFGPPRAPGAHLEQAHRDIARSAQARLEEALCHVVGHHLRETGETALCLAGGTFLNCVANGCIARLGLARDIFVQPAAHDAGTAIGAAALSWARLGGEPQLKYDSMFLGRAYDDTRVEAALKLAGARYHRLDESAAIDRLSRVLAEEKVVALFRGRMEFGPRALGNRSILASPRSTRTREILNELKEREQFRPLAPVVTEEAFADYFDGVPNRYMMFTSQVRPEMRNKIPAVVHTDGTARAQVVRAQEDPFLHAVLEQFARHAGPPVLVNTSLNVRGRPIDESPHDALSSFYTSGLDYLLIGSFLVERTAHTGGE